MRGSDFSQIAVSLARENAALSAVNIPFSVKSIYDLDPSTDGAPLLVCCEVLEHLENARTALERLRFVAQRYLIVSVPCEPLFGESSIWPEASIGVASATLPGTFSVGIDDSSQV